MAKHCETQRRRFNLRSLLMNYVNNPLEARVVKHWKRNDEIDPTLLDLQGIKRDIYNQPYVKPFHLDKHCNVILERSPLGSGKTTAMKDVLHRYNFKNALPEPPNYVCE